MRPANKLYALLFWLTLALPTSAQNENMDTIADAPYLAAYVMAVMLIGVFVMIFYNRIYYYKEKELNQRTNQLNRQLGLVLDSNKTQVWTFDPEKRIYSLLSGETKTDYLGIDFAQKYDRDDFNALRKLQFAIRDGKEEGGTLTVKGEKPTEAGVRQKTYEINVSVLKRDKQGHPTMLLAVQQDITEEQESSKKAKELSMRYHTVFNSSLVDMIYYDADGTMLDINDKACETFEVGNKQELLASKPNIKDVPALQGLALEDLAHFHASSITKVNDINHPIGHLEHQARWQDKIYYEQILTPVTNKDGQLAGLVMAGRNITEMVQSQHYQKWASSQLEKATSDIQTYIDNINFALQVSSVRLINYYPDSHELNVSSDLNKTQYRLSQLRCISIVYEADRRKTRGILTRMDRRYPGAFRDTIHTLLRDSEGRDIYLTFIIIPVTGRDGRISHYFGMCRNDTEMTYIEMGLRKETEKAQETEQLKNTFLLNMSYEIRTPLNAVLGFAHLLNAPHDEADEPVFAEEIKRNTGELLALVNDILFMSRLDAHMEEITFSECDFAALFDGYCYMGWSAVENGVKTIIENPYYHLIVTIDERHLGEVIQRFCGHSAVYTKEGMIKAKYDYRHGELNIVIEDTGGGINAEVIPYAFDRFARDKEGLRCGTGLSLPIAKELVEQMGGSIELQSEEGKGTTIYIIIPCEMTSMEKRVEELKS